MKGLAIGFWKSDGVIQQHSTDMEPSPETMAEAVQRHAERSDRPDRVVFIKNREMGPKLSFEWWAGRDYGYGETLEPDEIDDQ